MYSCPLLSFERILLRRTRGWKWSKNKATIFQSCRIETDWSTCRVKFLQRTGKRNIYIADLNSFIIIRLLHPLHFCFFESNKTSQSSICFISCLDLRDMKMEEVNSDERSQGKQMNDYLTSRILTEVFSFARPFSAFRSNKKEGRCLKHLTGKTRSLSLSLSFTPSRSWTYSSQICVPCVSLLLPTICAWS